MKKESKDKKEKKFSKERILMSKQFTTIEKDALKGILEEKEYTIEEVKEILKKFKTKKITESEVK